MNKNTPLLIILTILLASAALFWYARKNSSITPTNPQETTAAIVVGTNAEYPPFSFMEKNTIVGFDIDLIEQVCTRLNKKLQLIDMPFDALLPKIQVGDIQVIAAGLTATPERAQKVLFTKPYLTGDPLLIIVNANNPPATNVDDLKGKEVVVNEGYTADLHLSTIEGIHIKRLATPAEGFMALASDRAYAFVAAQSSVLPFLEKEGNKKFNVTTLAGVNDNYCLAISKKYPELLPEIQKILDTLEQDGTLDDLKAKWNL